MPVKSARCKRPLRGSHSRVARRRASRGKKFAQALTDRSIEERGDEGSWATTEAGLNVNSSAEREPRQRASGRATGSSTVNKGGDKRSDNSGDKQTRDRSAVLLGHWQTLLVALLGSLLLYLAFPPGRLGLLAWVAPLPWLWLVAQPTLAARRPYLAIYLASWVFWLALLQGIRLAHPALILGWIALAAYLAAYLPLFVAITRQAVHTYKIPLIVAAPIVWVGLELVRGRMISGFSLGGLANSQTEWVTLLQICDLAGAYGLSALMMITSSAILALMQTERSRLARVIEPVVAVALIGGALLYGQARLRAPESEETILSAALIQGSLDTVFEVSPERVRETITTYARLTSEARASIGDLDLVIWPESMFPIPRFDIEEPLEDDRESGLTKEQLRLRLEEMNRQFDSVVRDAAASLNSEANASRPTLLLLGTNVIQYGPGPTKIFNSAMLFDPQGTRIARYDKMHPVMFGEYVPLTDLFPFLYDLTPMAGGLSAGEGPVMFEVGEAKLSPSICFESTVPHLLRAQTAQLVAQRARPDCLVNITNDGWFWGSSLLDMHLHCAVLRAVENRRPMLVAANTGFSASIDGRGRLLERGPRRAERIIHAQVRRESLTSPYHTVGDLPAIICAALAWLIALSQQVGEFWQLLKRRN